MLLLFINLYMAMFTGEWNNRSWSTYIEYLNIKQHLNTLGSFITSIFGDGSFDTLGDIISTQGIAYSYPVVISFVLATITSIGIVVMAVKGVKKAFGIFFGHIR